jgi:hypothetical protein
MLCFAKYSKKGTGTVKYRYLWYFHALKNIKFVRCNVANMDY